MDILKIVFSKVRFVALAIGVATLVFTISVWLPNWQLLVRIMPSSMITFSDKASLLLSLYGSIQTNFTIFSASYTIIIAILFGINISLFLYYVTIRKGTVSGTRSVWSISGLISGFFGIGCTACGTFLLSILLGLFGGAWIIAILPFGGGEFGILGVVLLSYSVYAIIKKLKEPLVCK